MKFFKSATEKLVSKEVEYKLHEKVLRDLANDKKDLGIWGKAFVDADGDDKKTEAIYVKLMVQHYKDTAKSEAELEAIWNENYNREQIEEARQAKIREEERLEKEKQLQEEENAKKRIGQDSPILGTIMFTILFIILMMALSG
jgi:hypothetical protein